MSKTAEEVPFPHWTEGSSAWLTVWGTDLQGMGQERGELMCGSGAFVCLERSACGK